MTPELVTAVGTALVLLLRELHEYRDRRARRAGKKRTRRSDKRQMML